MGDFKDAKLWIKVSFLMMMLGFTLDLFAFATGLGVFFDKTSIEAMLIIGFLCFLIGSILVLCLVFMDECKDNKILKIIYVIVAFVAGVITIVGIAIWGGEYDDNNADPPAYATTLGVMASLLAILAGIFGILDLLGIGSG